MSIDLSLDRIRRLLALLPPYTRPTVHVAGTNGKGSVCALVSSILAASDPPLVVGRFNSPHLVSVLDSICIGNRPIQASTYSSAREQVEHTDKEHGLGASSFELLCCTALQVFERAAVDIVVLEVGMGGRLDATNAVPDDCIVASALTSVDLDHQAFLGDTVEAIAREKAAIARPGKPFVIGPQTHPEVVGVAEAVVAGIGGDLQATARVQLADSAVDDPLPAKGATFEAPSPCPVEVTLPCFVEPIRAHLPLHGGHQLANLQVAAGIISAMLTHRACPRFGLKLQERITPATIARGIRNTRWPGRLSYHTLSLPSRAPTNSSENRRLLVLADGAHNPASATALADYLSALLTKASLGSPSQSLALTYVLALSHSPPKTPAQTLAPLFSLAEHLPGHRQVRLGAALLRFTPPEGMPWVRAVPPSEMRAAINTLVPNHEPSIDLWPASDMADAEAPGGMESLERALHWAASRQGDRNDALVVVAGSLYLVADFYRLLERLGQAEDVWGAN
ncbi:Mur ligase [Trametes cingulata]|nr:Mur ligase [Trametes cingulata]